MSDATPKKLTALTAAKLCSLVYNPRRVDDRLVGRLLGDAIRYQKRIKCGDLVAWVVATHEISVVVFRGTVFENKRSAIRNFDADLIREHSYRVHSGYSAALSELWPDLERYVSANRNLVYTGHSQGGALATLAAVRGRVAAIDRRPPNVSSLRGDVSAAVIQQLADKLNPTQLITFASPRVGDETFAALLPPDNQVERYTTTNDVVPRLPPGWMDYEHGTSERYLNQKSRIVENPWSVYRFLDGILDRLSTPTLFDSTKAHGIENYIRKLTEANK